jgi:hypothetical protein
VLDAAGPDPVLIAFAGVQTAMMAVIAMTAARERARRRAPAPDACPETAYGAPSPNGRETAGDLEAAADEP